MHENRLVCREHSQILNSLNVCRQFQCYLTISHWPSNVNDAESVWFTGCLHLYSGVEHPCFNQYPEQTDFPDPVKITAILSCNSESLNLCTVFSCWIDLYLLLIEFDSVMLFEWLKRLVYVLILNFVNEYINFLNNTFTQILSNGLNSFHDLLIMQIDPIQPIHVTDEYTPYSIIPMMYPTNGTLLSDWPDFLSQRTYRSVQQSNLILHVQGVYWM